MRERVCRQPPPAEPPLGFTVHGRPGSVFKCLQLEIILIQPKVIFVLFVSKLISEIIIALATAAKHDALLLLVSPAAAVAVRATAVAVAAAAAAARQFWNQL